MSNEIPFKENDESDYNWSEINRGSFSDLSAIEDGTDTSILEKIGARAAINAINENRALQLPLTYEKDGWVIREYADGHVEKIEEIITSEITSGFKKGAVLHVKFY
ncbi:hypothetical protein [Chitinophaga ginsengisoli]|uniref:Uncharacterized protein n=1 Tax=Chitinophaga ginsengisoli TaxID=363837 RepID=A0A2P8FM19_9BACT|nr:hypothetical protein [Chitinophaga ginsengisoli]PSL22770.1 hypothetical protein CLV42_12031 [Chitinophaga ginsengisoli]